MNEIKFNPKKLEKLNNPRRLQDTPPEIIYNKLNLKNPKTLIEIGGGTAFFCKEFSKLSNPEQIYCCNISEELLTWVKNNVVNDYPNIIPIKSEESSIPLENSIAELVFMINLHHELENPDLILKEAFRLLKNNGKILIIDWKKVEMEEGPPTEIRYIPENIKTQLENADFKNIEIHNHLEKHFFLIGEK